MRGRERARGSGHCVSKFPTRESGENRTERVFEEVDKHGDSCATIDVIVVVVDDDGARQRVHTPGCESSCSRCPICRAGRKARDDGASSMRGRCRRWGWHSRLSYPTPRRSGEVHRSHLRRGLAWRMAVRAFLLAPPPWGSQVGLATCFLYTPLCSVLKSANAPAIKLLHLLLVFLLLPPPFPVPGESESLAAKIDASWAPLTSENLPDAFAPNVCVCVCVVSHYSAAPRILRFHGPTVSMTPATCHLVFHIHLSTVRTRGRFVSRYQRADYDKAGKRERALGRALAADPMLHGESLSTSVNNNGSLFLRGLRHCLASRQVIRLTSRRARRKLEREPEFVSGGRRLTRSDDRFVSRVYTEKKGLVIVTIDLAK